MLSRRFNLISLVLGILLICAVASAETELQIIESDAQGSASVADKATSTTSLPSFTSKYNDPVKYTLGAVDVVEIIVMRHPEFSGIYPINLEGKMQYKFVGDIDVTGLTKKGLEDKIKEIISEFVINPEVNVTILEYKSKIIYVIGEVGQPGKYYMRADAIPVREAVVQAGLPTQSAAMRRCQLVTPSTNGKIEKKSVDIYSVLYGGELKGNIDMHSGDVLYVPATVMAKVIRIINPLASTVGIASAPVSDVSGVRSAATTMAR